MRGLGFRTGLVLLLVASMVLLSGPCFSEETEENSDPSNGAHVILRGNVVMSLDAPAGGLEPSQRAVVVASRLAYALKDGETDFRPAYMAGETVVMAGDRLLATVDSETAALNNMEPTGLAWLWANNLRDAMGIDRLGPRLVQTGMASWYGRDFHGRYTASGEVFDERQYTAAHKTLPFGSVVRVTNLDNGLSVIVRINDRGPFVHNRVVDLSTEAAKAIGLVSTGIAPVRLEVVHSEATSG